VAFSCCRDTSIAPPEAWKARAYHESHPRSWLKRQDVRGVSLEVAMGDDRRLVATFVGVNANSEATGMNGSEDVADVLLMLMTYDPWKVIG
jgi:hypothetical protein